MQMVGTVTVALNVVVMVLPLESVRLEEEVEMLPPEVELPVTLTRPLSISTLEPSPRSMMRGGWAAARDEPAKRARMRGFMSGWVGWFGVVLV